MSKLGRHNRLRIPTLLLPMLVGVAYDSPAIAHPPPASTDVRARFIFDGRFARYLVLPNGEIDGLVLEDGSVTRFPPNALALHTSRLRFGDAIRIEGEAVSSPAGPVLARASVTKGNTTVIRGEHPADVGSGEHGVGLRWRDDGKRKTRGVDDRHEAHLRRMMVTGEIDGFSIDPHGKIDRILFVSGTNARAGKQVRLESLSLKAGDTITVAGKGGNYPEGSSLDISSMTLPNGEVLAFAPERAKPSRISHEGEVVCILLDPRGDWDGLVLGDGALVRIRPSVPNPHLTVGSSVRAEGEGTFSFIRAGTVTLTSTGAVLALATSPRVGRPPRVLVTLDASSTILRVVHDHAGKLDTLVLQDGSIVKIPPTLRDQAGALLSVGMKIVAEGKGGTYGLVKALRADRVQLASGQVFAEPERHRSDPPAER